MRNLLFVFALLPLMAMTYSPDAAMLSTPQTQLAALRTRTAVIRTSAVCGMCKTTIEKALNAVEGVEKATLDLVTKKVTVRYNDALVSTAALRQAIANAGYDADEVTARPKAYDNLPACCKKGSVCND